MKFTVWNTGGTFLKLKIIMLIGTILIVLGSYMLAVDLGVPLPNITASVPGASVSGSEVPPGVILLIVGTVLALGGGTISNQRYIARGKRSSKR